jgi:hypothetical protein
MQDILLGVAVAVLIIMQWFIIWECTRMKTTVGSHSTDLRTELGNLGILLDEALDFMNDAIPPQQGIVANTLASDDIKSVLLNGFLSKMMSPSENGPLKEIREISEELPQTTLETETESR